MKKILTALLIFAAAIGLTIGISACGDNGGTASRDGHVHAYTETVTEPTCTEKGFTAHICSCGDSYVDG